MNSEVPPRPPPHPPTHPPTHPPPPIQHLHERMKWNRCNRSACTPPLWGVCPAALPENWPGKRRPHHPTSTTAWKPCPRNHSKSRRTAFQHSLAALVRHNDHWQLNLKNLTRTKSEILLFRHDAVSTTSRSFRPCKLPKRDLSAILKSARLHSGILVHCPCCKSLVQHRWSMHQRFNCRSSFLQSARLMCLMLDTSGIPSILAAAVTVSGRSSPQSPVKSLQTGCRTDSPTSSGLRSSHDLPIHASPCQT